MCKTVEWIKSFFNPFPGIHEDLKEKIKEQHKIACENQQRVDRMMATLNGEEEWFLRVVRTKEEGKDV
jgi:hypothetical protein